MTTAPPAVPVEVDVQSFTRLFEDAGFPLAVDTYQRGFVWNDDKIRQLAEDLLAYQSVSGPKPPYYMGSILLHRNNDEQKKNYLIDGQQRITALCVLHHQLTGDLPRHCALTYSPKSAQRVRAAAGILNSSLALLKTIFDQIVFTVIRVERVDLAFTFFDTQNNRGVRLHATDLLKAYHLRAVTGESESHKEALQGLCARRWESIQQGTPVMSSDQQFDYALFTKFLWRARCWTGSRVTSGDHDALIDEFQKRTWPIESSSPGTIPIYRSRHNRLGSALSLTEDGQCALHLTKISLSSKAVDLPFAVRQPVQKGTGFFLYADKYASMLRWLVADATEASEVIRFREVHTSLIQANSLFLREIFLLASLMYVDQFGDQKLWEFSLWMDHALGAIRLEKQQVRHEAAQNFFRQGAFNLLDVIASAFRPEQVLTHLKIHHLQQETYAAEKIEVGKGVQGIYKAAVLAYYGRPDLAQMTDKSEWIADKLREAGV